MAESDSADFDLVWYLNDLSDKEFQSFKNWFEQETVQFGLPQCPRINLRMTRQDVANVLTTSYEAQHTWNVMVSIFQKIRREDLCEKINDRRNRSEKMHKVLMKEKFMLQWEKSPLEEFHHQFFCEVAMDVFYVLQLAIDPHDSYPKENLNILLTGHAAAGKSMIVKMAVFQWASDSGNMWKGRISYVVHLTAHEMNQMTHSSLVELISKNWSEGPAPIADILSDSRRLLFILEDLDNMSFTVSTEKSFLCSDSREQVPVPVLLASLLQRKMAPGSWFLLTSRPIGEEALKAFMKPTDCNVFLQLSDEMRRIYFNLFFKDSQRAAAAFKFVNENEVLVGLCRVPILCWITCSVLNQQMDMGDNIPLSYQMPTDIYAHFLARALTSGAGVPSGQSPLVLLKRLGVLAVEGLFQNTLNFSVGDLSTVGLTEADVGMLQALNILLPSNSCENHYQFAHVNIQEFCGAIGYLMTVADCPLPSGNKVNKDSRDQYNDFEPIINFIFGLLNERRRKVLETSLGCQLPMAICFKEYLLAQMQQLGDELKAMEHHTPLFYCLFENQEEEFVSQMMGFFSEATIYIQANRDLMVSLYCLKHCCSLRKLKLSVHIFGDKEFAGKLTPSQMKSLLYWRDTCSLLHTMETLRELEICNSNLDDTSERVLSKALRHPDCKLEMLSLSYLSAGSDFDDVFKAVVHNQNLHCLSLNCMTISLRMFSLLHEVLSHPLCSIRHLSLMKCGLQPIVCGEIASFLVNSQNLRKLTLSNNPLSHDGVKILCNALLQPECALNSLVLLFCCLTADCCYPIGRVLLFSKTLVHLDLSVNCLRDRGMLALSLPLFLPTCPLRELELCGCFFTGEICQYIASIIISNENLKSLELGSNNIGDAGVEQLCHALRHPNCKLENIGLEENMLTGACCESLAYVLISNKTLKRLNLLNNKLGDEGIAKLLESLGHPDCMLEEIGLPESNVSAETQRLLKAVREKNTNLLFVSQSWAGKEGREIGDRPGSMKPNLHWYSIFFKFPTRVMTV
ncbi:NACHT, LRR and PYD domains-containing protein 11 [Carlito syrichta]|uniref:NACHT, LRR and PYD domains-containing protein 11 n=1 Tax=Carlito syrichta TaxID=1868482 RepID=A0A1U7T308_CARSF|nr:NACHT, LRR and PYD domains-containing protein 11 [Carlito syrichta]